MSKYPEHAKLKTVIDKTQFAGEFIEFMQEQGVELLARGGMPARWQDHLYKFIDVDRWKLEDEKRAMLDESRTAQKEKP